MLVCDGTILGRFGGIFEFLYRYHNEVVGVVLYYVNQPYLALAHTAASVSLANQTDATLPRLTNKALAASNNSDSCSRSMEKVVLHENAMG